MRVSLFLVILVMLNCFIVAQSSDEDVNKQLEVSISAYDKQNDEKAIQELKKLLLAKPSGKQAALIRDQLGSKRIMEMLVKGGELGRIARALLLYSEKAPVRKETNEENIKKLVEQVATGNLFARHQATTLLEVQVGERVVPYMLPYLSNQTKDLERINVFLAAKKIGKTIVVPFIETLNSKDSFLRQQISILLGHIGDIRALPDLKRLLENPQEKDEVKKYVKIAIERIAKRNALALPAAKELYYRKALGYYLEDKRYMSLSHIGGWLDWRWENGNLVYDEVPAFAYNEIMSEHACYRSIDLDPTFKKAMGLLAQTYFAQIAEIESIQTSSTERELQLPNEEVEKFQKEKGTTKNASAIAAAIGPDTLVYALGQALRQNRAEVTVKLLETIGSQAGRRGSIPGVLLRALRNRDKRIRYGAAEAIVKIQPARRFSDSSRVVRVLQGALGEWDSRVVLVIEDNDATRNQLVNLIRGMNKVAFSATSGLEGLTRAKSFPPEDLIIISSQLKDISVPFLINALQEDYRTKNIPILILAPEAKKDTEKQLYQEKVKDIITTPVIEKVARSQIKEHINASKSDYKSRAKDIATRAAQALASVTVHNKIFDLTQVHDALADSALTRHDDIKGPCIMALGKLASRKSVKALRQIVFDSAIKLEIRSKAVWALGQVFNKNKVVLPSEDVTRLMEILKEKAADDSPEAQKQMLDFHNKILRLLGQANISAADRRKILVAYRIHKTIGSGKAKKAEEKKPIFKEEEEKEEKKEEKKEEEEGDDWGEESGEVEGEGGDDDWGEGEGKGEGEGEGKGEGDDWGDD